MRKYLISIFIIVGILSSCNDGQSESELKERFFAKQKNFEEVVEKFGNQNIIRSISVRPEYLQYGCKEVNSWSNCSDSVNVWETWNEHSKSQIYLYSEEEVLEHENINPTEYKFYVDFLKKNKLDNISKAYDCYRCVEIESSTQGLRFQKYKEEPVLKEDDEYLHVEKLNDKWYVYTRDWN